MLVASLNGFLSRFLFADLFSFMLAPVFLDYSYIIIYSKIVFFF